MREAVEEMSTFLVSACLKSGISTEYSSLTHARTPRALLDKSPKRQQSPDVSPWQWTDTIRPKHSNML